MDQKEVLLTQRMMADLARQTPSTTNRYISSHKIKHVETGNQRNLKYSPEDTRRVLNEYIASNYPITKKVHAFYNFKGGTGKTSLCFQTACHLALSGYNVLVIDADPQGNLSTSLGFDTTNNFFTLYDVIVNRVPALTAIKNIFPGLYCLPSNIACSRFDIELTMLSKREEQFKLHLSPLKNDYDFIIFDTNPNIGFVVRNIAVFADVINVPCETQPYSLNALKILFEDLEAFYNSMQMSLPQINIIPNKYEERYGTSAEAMAILRQYYKQYLIPDFAIRKAEDFNIAAKEGLPLCCVAKKNSIALQDIRDLMHFLIRRSSMNEQQMAA